MLFDLNLPLAPLLLVASAFVAIVLIYEIFSNHLAHWINDHPDGSDLEVNKLPYRAKEKLPIKAEHNFYRVLVHCLERDQVLFCQVRLADFIEVERGSGSWRRYFNKIQNKSVDFLVCSTETLAPLLVIELNDASHRRTDRCKRDRFLDRLFVAADLPLLRIPVQYAYTASELKLALREVQQERDASHDWSQPKAVHNNGKHPVVV